MRERKSTVLIVFARFGEGHYQAAKALEQQFVMQGQTVVHLVDLFEEAHPVFNAISRTVYAKSMVWFPKVYGWSYNLTNGMKHDRLFGRWIHAMGRRRMEELLRTINPDVIVHTFPFLAVYSVMERSGITIPSYTLITDYDLHTRWVHPQTDGYFVATNELKAQLMDTGIRAERIHVTGIPIRHQFRSTYRSRLEVCREDSRDPDRTYVLVMANALKDHKRLITELLKLPSSVTLLLVAGRNVKLYRRLTKCYANRDRVQVIGFVDHLEAYMSVAACIVTKAGGITLTEAIAMRVPVVVYRPIPGQEKSNADYWEERYVLRSTYDTQSTRATVEEFLSVKAVAEANGDFGNASEAIVNEVLREDAAHRALQRADNHMLGRRVVHEAH
ncbi:glycosyltransferase [Cohnella sp. GCM10020058]|uniref:MGDG synthase family glycosyltransferase n=1 Tax=Cohnella sp. GCM10020058 TaxID=3317330 RepID=UPI0036365941